MIDNVFFLDDFKRIFKEEVMLKKYLRFAFKTTYLDGEIIVECVLTSRYPTRDCILRCSYKQMKFTNEAFVEGSEENRRYAKFFEDCKKEIDSEFGFLPIEGYWE